MDDNLRNSIKDVEDSNILEKIKAHQLWHFEIPDFAILNAKLR